MKSAYIFCPEIFSSLEIIDHKNPSQNYPSKNQINYYRAKSSIKKNLIKIIPRAGKSYKYLQAQYNLNKRVAVQIKTTLKTKLGVLNSKKYIQKLGSSNLNDSGIWLENSGVSSEILKWWSEVNAVEPLLRPSYDSITSMHIARDMNFSKNAEAYYDFCSKLKNQYFNDVILCPHLIKGGADLAIIRLAKSLAKQGRKVLVISTSNTNSPWSHFLQNQQNIVFEEMSKIIPAASLEQQELFLMRVLQNWNIKAFTVINSYLGYKILWDYGNIIQKYCTVFLHTYAFDMSEDGYIFNMIPNGLVKAYDSVDYFVTDSAGYKEQLAKINGFDLNKIVSLYLPIESSIVPIIDAPEARKKVLWASRISTAKLVDVAVEVGKKLSEHGIELHFYGEPDPEYQNGVFESMIMGYKNIFYHGSYNGFHTIPYKNYDLFLMTSKNEGMPNVVLEASLANLYIVAPKVGGIPEIITNGVNGNLVVNNFEVEGYLKGVLDYYRNSDMNNPKKQRELNAAVAVRHSVASYDSSVIKLYTKKD
jgi:glycosyltransferase involved in cell wall biosynthesis